MFLYTAIEKKYTFSLVDEKKNTSYDTFMLVKTNKEGDGMSQEVLEIIKKMDLETLESQLALQCAPVLAGIKISNLLSLPKSMKRILKRFMQKLNLSYFVLLENDKKIVVLLYRKRALECYLKDEQVQNFLERMGYTEANLEVSLSILAERYEKHMSKNGEFPHEMGLFLGYPMEDVEGFIENDGKNFLCTGYWKVYKNKQEKTALFRQYEQAKEWMILFVSNGVDVIEAAQILSQGQLYSICL